MIAETSQENVGASRSQTSQRPVTTLQDHMITWDQRTGEVLKETGRKRPRTAAQIQHINEVKSRGGACDNCKIKHRKCDHLEAPRSEKGNYTPCVKLFIGPKTRILMLPQGANLNKRSAPDIRQQKTVKRTKVQQSPNEPKEFLQCIGQQFEYVLNSDCKGPILADSCSLEPRRLPADLQNPDAPQILLADTSYGTFNAQPTTLSQGNEVFCQQAPLSVPIGLEEPFFPWPWLDYPYPFQ